MDRHAQSGDVLDLRRSRDLYAQAFDTSRDDYYTGINAAAKSVLLGNDEDIAQGQQYAQRVQEIVGTRAKSGDYWYTATVAEVQLLQKNYRAAGRLYADAVAMAPKERGSHNTTWTQACRLMRTLGPTDEDRALVRKAFAHLPDQSEIVS
jgi:hypothetical protein